MGLRLQGEEDQSVDPGPDLGGGKGLDLTAETGEIEDEKGPTVGMTREETVRTAEMIGREEVTDRRAGEAGAETDQTAEIEGIDLKVMTERKSDVIGLIVEMTEIGKETDQTAVEKTLGVDQVVRMAIEIDRKVEEAMPRINRVAEVLQERARRPNVQEKIQRRKESIGMVIEKKREKIQEVGPAPDLREAPRLMVTGRILGMVL